jgi:chemotaxis protein methyltransferase CheR
MSQRIHNEELDEAESQILMILNDDFGYDPVNVATSWLHREIHEHVISERLETVRGLREKVSHDSACRTRLLRRLSGGDSGLFAEPEFFNGFRTAIMPLLRTYPFIRIWHIGCSSGEQVYSMAILLQEAGLYDRCRLYATDAYDGALRQCVAGLVTRGDPALSESRYRLSGGRGSLSDYYAVRDNPSTLQPALRRNVIFAQHNVETDGVFNEFQVIVCGGLFPLLDSESRGRVLNLIRGSLVRLGFLCLRAGEQVPDALSGMTFREFGPKGTFRRMS